jgi:glyoxylase-like metal-dependent hydrolase (beta-lactamase superfamily II)
MAVAAETLYHSPPEIPVMEIIPGIHQVDRVNGNSYLIAHGDIVVIDTGIPGSGRKILSYIRNVLHREPSEVTTIVLTHFHTDHIGGVNVLKAAAPDLKVAIHGADAGYVDGTKPLPRYPGLRGLAVGLFTRLLTPEFVPDILLEDSDRIAGLVCIHLPGHTPGSAAFLDEETGTLFAGDLLRSDGISLSESPAAFMMDTAQSRESIRKIAARDFDTLLIGHGKPFRPGAAVKLREFAGNLPA